MVENSVMYCRCHAPNNGIPSQLQDARWGRVRLDSLNTFTYHVQRIVKDSVVRKLLFSTYPTKDITSSSGREKESSIFRSYTQKTMSGSSAKVLFRVSK